jgi:hypothetical protein
MAPRAGTTATTVQDREAGTNFFAPLAKTTQNMDTTLPKARQQDAAEAMRISSGPDTDRNPHDDTTGVDRKAARQTRQAD